jgi:hypothetical protein
VAAMPVGSCGRTATGFQRCQERASSAAPGRPARKAENAPDGARPKSNCAAESACWIDHIGLGSADDAVSVDSTGCVAVLLITHPSQPLQGWKVNP